MAAGAAVGQIRQRAGLLREWVGCAGRDQDDLLYYYRGARHQWHPNDTGTTGQVTLDIVAERTIDTKVYATDLSEVNIFLSRKVESGETLRALYT